MRKIVISGPESTGKTTLSRDLALYFQCSWVPEYSRKYISELNHPYEFEDVKRIARKQIEHEREVSLHNSKQFVFFDTHLIVTQVWFEEVYNNVPDWLTDFVKKCHYDLFLLCAPDIQWEADSVRENPGRRREVLFNRYQTLIEQYGFSYRIIRGKGSARLASAIRALNSFADSGFSKV